MKVLQLTVHFSPNVGGVETHLDDLVFGLAKKEIETFVLTYRPLVVKTDWKMYEKHPYLRILRLPWFPGFFYKLVHSPIIEFLYLVPGLFFITPFIILFFQPNVVHAHGLVAGFVGTFWGKLLGRKVIISTHSLYHFPKSGMYTSFSKFIFNNADYNYCLSNQSVEELKELGVHKDKVGRFTYWVDLEKFRPDDKVLLKKKLKLEKSFVVLFVGRLIDIKGVPELLAIIPELPKNVVMLMAGAGPMAAEVQKVASLFPQKLKFVGSILNEDLPIYYNTADVLIVPSTHDEGFGRVILEALACGTPVIGSNRGAIPDAMDKSVGLLIDVSEENVLDSINTIQKDKKMLERFRNKSRVFAVDMYSEKNIDVFISCYNKS